MKQISPSKILLLNLLVIGGICSAIAQDYIDLASFSYTTAFNRAFEDTDSDNPIQEWNLNIDLPVVLNAKNALITGISANSIAVGLYPSSSPQVTLYAFSLRLGLNTTFSDRWSGTFLFIPKVASDFSTGFREGRQLGLFGLLTNTRSERLKHMYGLYTNTEEFGLLVVPIIGVYYKSTSGKFIADILLPVRADLNFAMSDAFSWGFRFDGLGTSFNIRNPGYQDHYVTRAANDFYAYGQLKLSNSILLRAKVGYSFFRNYKVYASDDRIDLSLVGIFFGDDRAILNRDLMDSFQFKTELVYRFDLSGKKEK